MDFTKEIKRLESLYLERPERVFSMYLNTDPADPDQQGREWRIHLKNAFQRFETYLEKDDDKTELNHFCKVKDKIKDFFAKNELDLQKSVIIFATPDESVWFAEILQVPVRTELYWEEIAKVDQLIELNQSYPKLGIILTQKEAIKIIETELGEHLNTTYYELDLDTENWKRHTGSPHAQPIISTSGASVKREQFDRRFEANRQRWYRRIAGKLDQLAKDNDWKQIYMVGNRDETRDLAEMMTRQIHYFINKNMLDKDAIEVIRRITE